MLQLKNASPFAPALTVLPDRDGVDTLYITVRGAFTLLPKLATLPKPVPPVLVDEYWGEPGQSSLKYASELHVGKPTTDVILIGQAWSSGGRVAETSTMVSVAGRSKTVKVFGDRTWTTSGGFTSPAPFESIPLVYERAFGGHHRLSDEVYLAEERNPVGVGFVGKRSTFEMIGQKLPNFEDPRALIERLGDAPPPRVSASSPLRGSLAVNTPAPTTKRGKDSVHPTCPPTSIRDFSAPRRPSSRSTVICKGASQCKFSALADKVRSVSTFRAAASERRSKSPAPKNHPRSTSKPCSSNPKTID